MHVLISTRQPQDEAREFASWLRPFVTISVSCIAVVLFFLARNLIHRLASNADFLLPAFVLATAIALLVVRVSYDGLGSIYKTLARTTAAGLIAYLVLEPPSFTLADQANAHVAAYVDVAYWVALVSSTLGLWRPSFLFPAGFYVISTRYAVDDISGFALSVLDIRFMVEMAQFLAIGACAVALFRWAAGRWSEYAWTAPLRFLDFNALSLCLAFSAIGFHLGNYFCSGLAKLLIGPHLLTWIAENQTQNIMIGALKRGVLPSGHLPNLTQMLFESLGSAVVISNAFVVAIQLFAILAVLRLNWLRFATLAYDGLHIGIYVFGGLLFWPWIWTNVSILLAVRNKDDREVGWPPKLCCIIVMLLGMSLSLGASARLAWWDVTDIKIPMVQAQTESGAWIDVPVSFFMSHSYAVSHGNFDRVKTQGHYLPTRWGSAREYERRLSSGTCSEPAAIDHPESPKKRAKRIARVKAFIRAHHAKMVELAEDGSQTSFYLRSHHHPSNPWLYETFNETDLSKIERYRVVTQSVCLSMFDGRLKERVIKQDVITIELGG